MIPSKVNATGFTRYFWFHLEGSVLQGAKRIQRVSLKLVGPQAKPEKQKRVSNPFSDIAYLQQKDRMTHFYILPEALPLWG